MVSLGRRRTGGRPGLGSAPRVPINVQYRAYPPTPFDAALHQDLDLWRRIVLAGGLGAVTVTRELKYADDPAHVMPSTARRFQKTGSLVLPADDGADNLVLQFRIPIGYDAVLNMLTNVFTGTGFVDSSGDLTWRLKFGQWWVRDYGAVDITLGDITNPFPLIGGGLRAKSNQLVSYYVAVAAGAAARLQPDGRVICSVAGWIYPTA